MVTRVSETSNFCLNVQKYTNQQATQSAQTLNDYRWPWVTLTRLLYYLRPDDVPGTDLKNSMYTFSQSKKDIMSWTYNKQE